jgi:hypothetical protein
VFISHLIASFYTMLAMQWQRRRKINLVQNGNQIWISFFKNVMWFLSMSPCLTKPGGFLIPQKQKTVAIILYIICKQHVNKFPPGFTMKKNQGLLIDRGMFNKETIRKMKKGAFLVNNARGAIVDVDAVKEACESGQLGGM